MAKFNSISDYFKALSKRINNSDALLIAVKDVNSEMGERIFEDGKAVDGEIGKYSTEPTYIGDKNSPKTGTHQGEYGDTEFMNGKPHTSTYYAGGYSEYRSAMGRSNKTVNLDLTGRLKTNFLNGIVELKEGVIGIKLRGENADKARGNQARFRKRIFGITRDERIRFKRTLKFELIKSLKKDA